MPSILEEPWGVFTKTVMALPEETCWELLLQERRGKNRIQIIQRLYGRANKLRGQRERREWFGE